MIRKIWGFDIAPVITNDYQIKGFDMTNMLGLLKNIETSVNPQESGARSGLKLFTVGWMVSKYGRTIRNLRVVDNRGNLRRPNRFNVIILCVIYVFSPGGRHSECL